MNRLRIMGPGLMMIILSLIILSQALRIKRTSVLDPAGGSFLPSLIALLMFAMGISVIIRNTLSAKKLEKRTSLKVDVATQAMIMDKEAGFSRNVLLFIFFFFFLLASYVALLPYITFFPATFIFLVGSILYLRDSSLLTALLVAGGSILIIYLLFSQFFKIIFP